SFVSCAFLCCVYPAAGYGSPNAFASATFVNERQRMTTRRQHLKTLKQKIVTVALSTLFTASILASAVAMLALAQDPSHPGQPAALKQRVVRPKPARTVINPAKARADVIVVKFREGTRIRE